MDFKPYLRVVSPVRREYYSNLLYITIVTYWQPDTLVNLWAPPFRSDAVWESYMGIHKSNKRIAADDWNVIGMCSFYHLYKLLLATP